MEAVAVRFAVCLENDGFPVALERNKVYQVLEDADAARVQHLRVIDESGEDYLYPAAWFAVLAVPAEVAASVRAAAAR